MSNARFEIKSFTPHDKNTLRGFLDIAMPDGMIVHGISLHERDGARWLGLPSRKFEKDGTAGYAPVIEFISREVCDEFRDAVLEALDRYQHGGRA